MAEVPLGAWDRPHAGRSLPDLGQAMGSLRRALKLYARGERDRARRLVTDSLVLLRVPAPGVPSLTRALELLAPSARSPRPLAEPADVIVPIHNGADHVRRLFSTLFEHTDPRHRILLADDGSTDPAVVSLLAAAAERPNVRITRSDGNCGFIATVNAAMSATTRNAVVLNSDTEVPPGWIDRLLRPIEQNAAVASTTPFSNAAQIFSVPVPDRDHGLPPDLDLVAVDEVFARLHPGPAEELEAPTAIGFCMGISRRAWAAVGPFDAQAFGRGYCEETDWSLRSRAAGWSNLLVPNLFVFHLHGGSFVDCERKALLERNLAILHRRWPDYYRRLADFRRRDPWRPYRAAGLLALAAGAPAPGEIELRRVAGGTMLEAGRGDWRTRLLATPADTADAVLDALATRAACRG
ncbi:MAG: glycosyltransferase family 2 protein [Geminicoccaceae bacterium]